MKLKFLFSTALIALSTASFAQTWVSDSIAMGTGYANDVYYELKQGATKLQPGNDWHLGFQMSVFGEPNFNAAIRANHAKTGVEVYVLSKSVNPALFTAIGTADTVGKTNPAQQLLNNDTSWGTGALYQNRDVSDIFSFGWGEYGGAATNHAVTGNCIYLLKTTAGNAYKLWIQKYVSLPADSVRYILRVAKLDGTNDNTVTIWRKGSNQGVSANDFTDRLFAYYDIEKDSVVNREPSRQTWDMVFTQYKDSVSMGPGSKVIYLVTGILTNQSVEVADVRQINPDPSLYKTYTRTTVSNEIGYDWKTNDPITHLYSLDTTANFFIKTKTDSAYYQLQFTRFDGATAPNQGKVVFNKRYLGSALAVNNVAAASLNAWYVSPNPAAGSASLMLDAKVASPSARMIVTDMAGHTVLNTPLAIQQGMNAFGFNTGAWPAGMYAVQVAGADWKLSTRLVVVH